MPKIFALRHQLAEQQARLKQLAKGGGDNAANAANNGGEDRFDEARIPSEATASAGEAFKKQFLQKGEIFRVKFWQLWFIMLQLAAAAAA